MSGHYFQSRGQSKKLTLTPALELLQVGIYRAFEYACRHQRSCRSPALSLFSELKRRNVIKVAIAYLLGIGFLITLQNFSDPTFGSYFYNDLRGISNGHALAIAGRTEEAIKELRVAVDHRFRKSWKWYTELGSGS